MAQSFSKKLRTWRRKANLLQKQAADALAVNLRTYQGWEESYSTPRPLALAELERRMAAHANGK